MKRPVVLIVGAAAGALLVAAVGASAHSGLSLTKVVSLHQGTFGEDASGTRVEPTDTPEAPSSAEPTETPEAADTDIETNDEIDTDTDIDTEGGGAATQSGSDHESSGGGGAGTGSKD